MLFVISPDMTIRIVNCDDATGFYFANRIVQVFENHFSDDSMMLYLIKDEVYELDKHIYK